MRNISKYLRKKIAFIICFSMVMSMYRGNVYADEAIMQDEAIGYEENDVYTEDEDKTNDIEQDSENEDSENNESVNGESGNDEDESEESSNEEENDENPEKEENNDNLNVEINISEQSREYAKDDEAEVLFVDIDKIANEYGVDVEDLNCRWYINDEVIKEQESSTYLPSTQDVGIYNYRVEVYNKNTYNEDNVTVEIKDDMCAVIKVVPYKALTPQIPVIEGGEYKIRVNRKCNRSCFKGF